MNFVDDVNMLRDEIREKDGRVRGLHKHDIFEALKNGANPSEYGRTGGPLPDENEMRANIQLAHRHLEDARMRLGKVIQAFEGRDIFDAPAVATAIEGERNFGKRA